MTMTKADPDREESRRQQKEIRLVKKCGALDETERRASDVQTRGPFDRAIASRPDCRARVSRRPAEGLELRFCSSRRLRMYHRRYGKTAEPMDDEPSRPQRLIWPLAKMAVVAVTLVR